MEEHVRAGITQCCLHAGQTAAPVGGVERRDPVVEGPWTSARLAVPEVDERYSPLLDILPLQKLALAIALSRGENPDAPRGLKKVTETL